MTVLQLDITLDYGRLTIATPERLSKFDVEQIKAHFDIILRQCERRAKEDKK